jgi:hypothetical protein
VVMYATVPSSTGFFLLLLGLQSHQKRSASRNRIKTITATRRAISPPDSELLELLLLLSLPLPPWRASVGASVGAFVGVRVGDRVGVRVGELVKVGARVGERVVGVTVGVCVGDLVGALVGASVG